MDTATTLERIDFVRQSLSLASRGAKFDVAVIVPELEVMFFQTIDVARKIFGKKVDERFIVQGQLQPKATMLAERISTSQLMRKRKGTLREILGVTPLVKSIVDQIAVIDD
ncbi:hypothetical protein E9536_25895 [Burkholderia sp. LS-044]|nr:hypothetical protein E9536_25895 [Burkholderia sp. LS-044]